MKEYLKQQKSYKKHGRGLQTNVKHDKAFTKHVLTKAAEKAAKEFSNVEAKPHSTEEGRISSGLAKASRYVGKRLQSGGSATHGYGKAYLKGGRVK